MKISEQLSIIRQKEAELLRSYDHREALIQQTLSDNVLRKEDLTDTEIETKQKEFLSKKKEKIQDIESKMDELKEEIIASKNAINKSNVERGLDKKLIEMKYIRLELSKLMNLIKKDRYSMSRSIGIDTVEELGINERIRNLEIKKNKLDAEINFKNWNTEL